MRPGNITLCSRGMYDTCGGVVLWGTVYLGCLELVSSIFARVTVNDDEGLFILIVDAYSNMVRAVSSLMLSFILIKTVEQVVPAEKGNSLIQSFIMPT